LIPTFDAAYGRSPMDLASALRTFIRTCERGSISAAARDLSVSQPAVTKQLKSLEDYVGARLLERSSRVVRPTALGQNLYEASRSALATIDSAVEGLRRDMGAVEGHLRVHAPTCIGAKHIYPIVAAFQDRYPNVSVDLFLEDRRIDLVHENIDLAIRYDRPDGQDLIIRRLGHVRRFLVASPEFLARSGPIRTLEQLSELDLIVTATVLSPRGTLMLKRGTESVEFPARPLLRTNNAQVCVDALLSGRSAGPVQHLLVSKELSEKRLVRILPNYDVKSSDVYLLYPSVRFMRPAVRAFTDFAVPALRAIEGIDADSSGAEATPRVRSTAAAPRQRRAKPTRSALTS
jgi:DNA-binding transcriptional LysR family regulator